MRTISQISSPASTTSTVTDGDNDTTDSSFLKCRSTASEHNTEHFLLNGIHYITVGYGCDKDDPIAAQPWTQVGALTGRIMGPNDEGVRFAQDVGSFGIMEVTDASMPEPHLQRRHRHPRRNKKKPSGLKQLQ